RVGDIAVGVDAQGGWWDMTCPACCFTVELHDRREPLRHTTDDRERHRQVEHPCADRRLGVPADRDPYRKRVLDRPRVDGEIVDRSAVLAAPRDAFVFAQKQKQLKLLDEELVVVLE